MKKKKEIPAKYFEDQEFIVEESHNDVHIVGVLGPNPTAEQIVKFELCRLIASYIRDHDMSYSNVADVIGLNNSEVSRITNHHLDRFTIDRLLRIYSLLDSPKALGKAFRMISTTLDRFSA